MTEYEDHWEWLLAHGWVRDEARSMFSYPTRSRGAPSGRRYRVAIKHRDTGEELTAHGPSWEAALAAVCQSLKLREVRG